MTAFLCVGFGGFLGAALRYAVMLGVGALMWRGHWATLTVNAVGSLLIGFLAPYFESPSHPARLFLVVGVLGGFTTFSSFSLDTLTLLNGKETGLALLNIFLNVAVCLGFVWCGFKLHRLF